MVMMYVVLYLMLLCKLIMRSLREGETVLGKVGEGKVEERPLCMLYH